MLWITKTQSVLGRNKLEEDDNISDNEMETKNGMKDLELKNFISFDEERQNTMKIILHQRVFQDGTIIQKYYSHGKIPLPIQLPKEE